MKPTNLWQLAIKTALAIVLLGGMLLVYGIYQYLQQVKSEYETVRVVQMIEDYVKSHGGQWPSSWQDLDETEVGKQCGSRSSYYQQFAAVDFSCRSEQLLRDSAAIYEAVTPVSRRYVMYPHAKQDLDRVMQAIRDARMPPEPSK
jgi:hypothetical protein